MSLGLDVLFGVGFRMEKEAGIAIWLEKGYWILIEGGFGLEFGFGVFFFAECGASICILACSIFLT